MAAKFALLQKDPLAMTDRELRAALSHLKDSELMRSLILAEVARIRAGGEQESRTMRNLWYERVKPVLSRLGALNAKTRGGKDIDWPAKLSVYLAELVRSGETSYEELAIIDGSRQRRVSQEVSAPVVSVPVVGAHFPWLILFTEKDTIWPVLEDLASLYGVSAISGGGEPSLACTENTALLILRSENYKPGEPLVLLTLTDYDPAGYTIANAQYEQLRDMASSELEHLRVPVVHERLGLIPDQLTQEERAASAYEPKEKGLAEWYATTGGVDGAPLGLELDALPLSRLRRMFAEAIESHIDLTKREQDLRRAFVDLIAWQVLSPAIERMRAAMIEAVRSDGLWQRIESTEIPADLFSKAAIAGWDSIDPVSTNLRGRPLFDCIEDVRAAMSEALQ